MKKLFYIMPSALDVLNESKPAYTPMTNHKTELHTVPVVLLSEYRKLIEIIEKVKAWDIGCHGQRLKIPLLIRIDIQHAIIGFEAIDNGELIE